MTYPTSILGYGSTGVQKTSNLGKSTLVLPISAIDTAFDVQNAALVTPWPTDNFVIRIENELLFCSSRTGNALTVTRGFGGTMAVAHVQGLEVRVVAASEQYASITTDLIAVETRLGTGVLTTGAVPFAASATAYGHDSSMFFWDATNKRIGFGTNTPAGRGHFYDATATVVVFIEQGSDSSFVPALEFRKFGATGDQNGRIIGEIRFDGHDGSGYFETAKIRVVYDLATGSGDLPTALQFYTTPNGSTADVLRATLSSAGNFGLGVAPLADMHIYRTTHVELRTTKDSSENQGQGGAWRVQGQMAGPGLVDYGILSCVKTSAGGVFNAHWAISVHNGSSTIETARFTGPGYFVVAAQGAPSSGDFFQNNAITSYRIDDTHVGLAMKGSDGTVRTASVVVA